jgi:hypothetical protein
MLADVRDRQGQGIHSMGLAADSMQADRVQKTLCTGLGR